MRVQLLYFDDCPSWRQAAEQLESLADEFDLDINHELVDTREAADRLGFHGSPSIIVDGKDLFPTHGAGVGLSCRIYPTPNGPAGCPTLKQTHTALKQRRIRP